MWSIGCILLEILNGRPLFIADSSLNHIIEVNKVLGMYLNIYLFPMNSKPDNSDRRTKKEISSIAK